MSNATPYELDGITSEVKAIATKLDKQLDSNDVPDWGTALLAMTAMILSFCIVIMVMLVLFAPFIATALRYKNESTQHLLTESSAQERPSIKVELAPKHKQRAAPPKEDLDDMDI